MSDSVRVSVLGVNDVGNEILTWLRSRDDAEVLSVIETESKLDTIHNEQPDLVISAGFRHIVPDEYLAVPSRGAVNLHKSYLPYNRGANPNVWSIIDDHPAGVSIHYMTASIDGGSIIDRRKVPIHPDDTGRSLYERLERTQLDQFKEQWPAIRDGDPDTIDQDPDTGTYHKKQDFVDLWELDKSAETTVGNFLDRLRALTFPPYKNAYFTVDGTKYHVEIDITPADEEDGPDSEREIPMYSENSFD